jgi:hypothetical protein
MLGLLAGGAAPQQRPAREHVIDLTIAPAPGAATAMPGPRQLTLQVPFVASADVPRKQPPIRVSAPELERPDYRIGDPFVFEVVFQNVSDAPIAFPTLPDGSAVDREMPGAALAAVGLAFDDQILGHQVVSPQALYGANPIEGSLIAVQPGERVRIRARGTWILSRSTGTPYEPHWPRPLKVKASVMLVGNGVLYLQEQSNAVTPVQFGTKKQ